ncbi:D-glucuronyl C5-epimerase family protein [Flagellimonas sp. 2504JD4-2]
MKRFRIKKIFFVLLFLYVISLVFRSIGIHKKWQVEEQKIESGAYSKNYPITFIFNKDEKALVKDQNGVYMTDRSKKTNFTKGQEVFYSPTAIGLASLRDLQKANNNTDTMALRSFLANAKWLLQNQDSLGRIPFGVPLSTLDKKIDPPWYSALSQGLALSVFSRAYEVTKDSLFLVASINGLKPFSKDINEGGVMSSDIDFGVFLEEYPTSPAVHVLNGYNYALLGLNDVYEILNSNEARELFVKFTGVLKDKIRGYDLGSWSAYSMDQPSMKNHYTYCNPWYHKLHIIQLRILYDKTNIQEFEQYANKFNNNLTGPVPFILYPIYVGYSDVVWTVNLIK